MATIPAESVVVCRGVLEKAVMGKFHREGSRVRDQTHSPEECGERGVRVVADCAAFRSGLTGQAESLLVLWLSSIGCTRVETESRPVACRHQRTGIASPLPDLGKPDPPQCTFLGFPNSSCRSVTYARRLRTD